MPSLGSAALVVAFGLVVYSAVAGGYAAYRGRRRLLDSATNALYAAFASVLLAAVVLLAALTRHDFSFAYVASHTSRELPTGYTISAFWGGQEGSLLLWVLILAVFGAAVASFGRALPATLKARVLAVQGLIGLGYTPLEAERLLGSASGESAEELVAAALRNARAAA